jgi:hypothetical protein
LNEKLGFTRHLIECHCILKIFQNKSKPLYHKFPVFSLLLNEEIQKKYVSCNNCGAIHEILDICKSDIKWGNDGFEGLVVIKDDIKFNLQSKNLNNVVELLETAECDISVWEIVEFCLENNIDHTIVLSKQDIQDNTVYNCLNISAGLVKIKKEISQRYI